MIAVKKDVLYQGFGFIIFWENLSTTLLIYSGIIWTYCQKCTIQKITKSNLADPNPVSINMCLCRFISLWKANFKRTYKKKTFLKNSFSSKIKVINITINLENLDDFFIFESH